MGKLLRSSFWILKCLFNDAVQNQLFENMNPRTTLYERPRPVSAFNLVWDPWDQGSLILPLIKHPQTAADSSVIFNNQLITDLDAHFKRKFDADLERLNSTYYRIRWNQDAITFLRLDDLELALEISM